MSQLGHFQRTVQDTSGNALSGVSVTIYREGATVNGNQSGVTPLTINVRHPGRIIAADTVFINTTSGTTYSVDSKTATTVVVSGFVGTLSVSNGDRLVPSNTKPTLYADDQGGATTANPLTTSSTGYADAYMETGAYEVLISGGGATTTLFQSQVNPVESPAIVYSSEIDSATAVAHIEDTRFSMATAGAKLKSWRNVGTEKAAVDKDGTGIFPRIGPSSTATTGGAIRIVDGNLFPLTVAGVQAALDELDTAGGGLCLLPHSAGILIGTTSVKVPNRAILRGFGPNPGGTFGYTFRCNASTNVSAILENKNQDGTQGFMAVEDISIDGNKSSGGTTTVGLKLVSVFSPSYFKNINITNCSGDGIRVTNATNFGSGPLLFENIRVADNNGDNFIATGTGSNIATRIYHIESDRPGTGKACIKFVGAAGMVQMGHVLSGVYIEAADATADGILLDGTANISIDGVHYVGASTGLAQLVRIINTQAGVGSNSPSGITIRNISMSGASELTNVIVDTAHSVTVTNSVSGHIQFYAPPNLPTTSGEQGQIIGVQYQRRGTDISSTATLNLGSGSVFHITGTTTITNIATTTKDSGRIVTLIFDGALTFTDGNNLKLAGNFVTTADDTITLISDGTNWFEMARSVN